MLGETGDMPPDSVAGVAAPEAKVDDVAVETGKRGVGSFRWVGWMGRDLEIGGANNHTRMAGFPMRVPAIYEREERSSHENGGDKRYETICVDRNKILTTTSGDAPTEGYERYYAFCEDLDHLFDEFPSYAGVAAQKGVGADKHGGTSPGWGHGG